MRYYYRSIIQSPISFVTQTDEKLLPKFSSYVYRVLSDSVLRRDSERFSLGVDVSDASKRKFYGEELIFLESSGILFLFYGIY